MERRVNGLTTARSIIPRVAAVVVVLWFAMGLAVVAGATERSADEVSRITRDVSESIESPYCPGQTLQMCPSAAAAETRRDVQNMARQGMDADEIKQELVQKYGEGYELIEPPMSDQMTLLGGIIGGFAIAIGVVGFLARRRLTDDEGDDGDRGEPQPQGETGTSEADEAYLEELRAEYQD